MNGLNMYDYGARWRGGDVPPWPTSDPLAEKYYSISPYAYCLNNPLKFVDPDGKDPGDVFKTARSAAHDWGMYYNGASILNKVEYGSKIFVIKKDEKVVGYSYSVAKEGSAHYVATSSSPNGETAVADIHSHGNDDNDRDDNHFSKADKKDNDKLQINGFLASPNGLLQEYNTATKKTTTVSTDLPSDPSDPDRKNTNKPTDQRKEAVLWNSSKETTSLWMKKDSDGE